MTGFLLVFLFVLGQAITPPAQNPVPSDRSVLHGIVRDPYGAVVWRALVTVSEVSRENGSGTKPQEPKTLKPVAKLNTNDSGQYSVEVPPGTYQVCVTQKEFTTNCRIAQAESGRDFAADFSLVFDPVYKQAHDPADPEVMDRRLHKLAGAKAIDCGRVAVNESAEKSTACALDAFHRSNPFHVSYEMKGIDAQLSDGVALDSSGNGYGVIFDSLGVSGENLPKGATMPDGSHTVVLGCPRPIKLRKTKNGKVTCFKSSQQFFWDDGAAKH